MNENQEQSIFRSLLPPRKEDKLFCSDVDWEMNACINYTAKPENLYNEGYQKAAKILVTNVFETHSEQDYLIYPIVYLYRHNIELLLKDIAFSAADLIDKEFDKKEKEVLARHKLLPIWIITRPLLNAVCSEANNPEFPIEDIEGIESYIKQIQEYDSDGQSFRYATDTKRKQFLLKSDLKLININVFSNHLERLSDYLRHIHEWFQDLVEEKYNALLETL